MKLTPKQRQAVTVALDALSAEEWPSHAPTGMTACPCSMCDARSVIATLETMRIRDDNPEPEYESVAVDQIYPYGMPWKSVQDVQRDLALGRITSEQATHAEFEPEPELPREYGPGEAGKIRGMLR